MILLPVGNLKDYYNMLFSTGRCKLTENSSILVGLYMYVRYSCWIKMHNRIE